MNYKDSISAFRAGIIKMCQDQGLDEATQDLVVDHIELQIKQAVDYKPMPVMTQGYAGGTSQYVKDLAAWKAHNAAYEAHQDKARLDQRKKWDKEKRSPADIALDISSSFTTPVKTPEVTPPAATTAASTVTPPADSLKESKFALVEGAVKECAARGLSDAQRDMVLTAIIKSAEETDFSNLGIFNRDDQTNDIPGTVIDRPAGPITAPTNLYNPSGVSSNPARGATGGVATPPPAPAPAEGSPLGEWLAGAPTVTDRPTPAPQPAQELVGTLDSLPDSITSYPGTSPTNNYMFPNVRTTNPAPEQAAAPVAPPVSPAEEGLNEAAQGASEVETPIAPPVQPAAQPAAPAEQPFVPEQVPQTAMDAGALEQQSLEDAVASSEDHLRSMGVEPQQSAVRPEPEVINDLPEVVEPADIAATQKAEADAAAAAKAKADAAAAPQGGAGAGAGAGAQTQQPSRWQSFTQKWKDNPIGMLGKTLPFLIGGGLLGGGLGGRRGALWGGLAGLLGPLAYQYFANRGGKKPAQQGGQPAKQPAQQPTKEQVEQEVAAATGGGAPMSPAPRPWYEEGPAMATGPNDPNNIPFE